ncbi:MAG: phosphate regulon sensor histidine kinase PhoR [Pseudomonadota bacterium]
MRVGAALLAGSLLGLVFGHTGWFVAAALAAYLVWSISELVKLHRWLNAPGGGGEPPDSFGLWGEIFDSIYRLRKREQSARNELLAIIDRARDSVTALNDAVVVIGRDGMLEWWNPAAENLLGLRWPQDKDQPVVNLVRDPRFREYIAGGDYGRPLEMPSPRSDAIHLHLQVTVFGNGDRLLIARDVTRLHQLEQIRRDFVANVSHELKTPLTVIKGYLETLSQVEGNPRQARALSQMTQQAERMDRLVNDLLLLSRLESTQPESGRQAVAVRPLLENIRNDVLAAHADKQHRIALRIDSESKLLGSDIELQSAFSNILVNAARYSDPQAEIDMHWWVDDKGAHLAIRDSGIGIEPHHLPRLTERFYRTDKGRSIAEGGTGLGLAIVKHVLKRHDATLDIRSEPGKGSTFTCHFPRERLAAAGTPAR